MTVSCSTNNPSSFKLLYSFWQKISERRQGQIKLLILLMLFNGICEIISIGQLYLFISSSK